MGWLARIVRSVVAAALAVPATATAATVEVPSPDGRLVVVVDDAGGNPGLAATLDGAALLDRSPLGLVTSAGALDAGLAVAGTERATVDEPVRTTTGPRRARRVQATEAAVTFAGGARRLVVRVRVTDTAIAYRYELPGPATDVLGERGGFAPAAVTRSWTAPHSPNGEALWGGPSERTAFGRPGELATNALLRAGDGDRFVLLTEAGVDGRNAAARLVQDGSLYRYGLPRRGTTTAQGPMESGDPVPTAGRDDWTGPWRVAIAGRLAEVATSTAVADLAAPPRGDFSWVRPGIAAWSWWSDNASPSSLTRQRAYVDFAAAQGWSYVTVDEGWPRLGPGELEQLAAYAEDRGVRLLLWFNQRSLADAAARASALDRLAALGIAGVKVDFFDDETQPTMQLVDALLRDAAARRLLVDLHGFTPPRGLERTWPNLVSYEGIRGAEYYKLAPQFAGLVPAPTPAHNTILAFTRAVAGPADYTPLTFTAPDRRTSPGHELALAVVLQTGLLHPADSIEAYAARPGVLAALRGLPVTWDDSRLVEGFPGRGATIARRAGRDWWVGSITAGAAREVPVDLGFLGPGPWTATTYGDAAGDDVTARTEEVTAATRLRVPVAQDGGFLLHLRPLLPACGPRRTTVRLPRTVTRRGIRSVRVRATGRRVRTVRVRGRRILVDLGPAPRGRRIVTVEVRGRDGRVRRVRRTFAACTG